MLQGPAQNAKEKVTSKSDQNALSQHRCAAEDATGPLNAKSAMALAALQKRMRITMTMKIKPEQMRTYHITYFIHRGDVEQNEKPLLGGVTLEAESIILAIGRFLNENKVQESEIKYIVEL
jgi:hypothetical protein